jgi:hypothetical protein
MYNQPAWQTFHRDYPMPTDFLFCYWCKLPLDTSYHPKLLKKKDRDECKQMQDLVVPLMYLIYHHERLWIETVLVSKLPELKERVIDQADPLLHWGKWLTARAKGALVNGGVSKRSNSAVVLYHYMLEKFA